MRASDRAYEILRRDILNIDLKPGQALAEVEQAERIGVSRTPVREAISRLLLEGLAEPNPGRGTIVAPISMQVVYSLFELREGLDPTAAALAAQKGNHRIFDQLAYDFAAALTDLEAGRINLDIYYGIVERLDHAIDKAADNRYLLHAQGFMRDQLARVRKLSKTNPNRLIQAAREHEQIARAIATGNPDLARAATKLHLANTLAAIETASQQEDHELFATTGATAASR